MFLRWRVRRKIRDSNESALRDLAQSPTPNVRKCLASILATSSLTNAVPTLVSLLNDSDLDVSITAARSLATLKPAAAITPLLEQLRSDVLGRFFVHSSAIVPTNEEQRQRSGQGRYVKLVSAIACALSKIGDKGKEAVEAPLIGQLWSDSPRISIVSAVVLAHIRSEKALPSLLALVKKPDADQLVQTAAFYAINKISPSLKVPDIALTYFGMDVRKMFDEWNFEWAEKLEFGVSSRGLADTLEKLASQVWLK